MRHRNSDAALLSTPEAVPDGARELLTSTDPWHSIHLAIGVTASLLAVAPEDALAHLRAYAFTHDLLLTELAAGILDDHIDPVRFLG